MRLTDLIHQVSILLSLPIALLAGGMAAVIVIARDWRLVLFCYALLSATLAMLLAQVVPVEWGLLQAIVGGLVALICYRSARQVQGLTHTALLPDDGGQDMGLWPQMASLTSFRLMTVALLAVALFALRDQVHLPQLSPLLRDVVLWLAMVSLLGLALHEEPLHAGLALLTGLGGAELLLFTLIQRRMLVGLVMGGQVLLGLVVAYLVLARGLAGTVHSGREI
jgi:hypothetical protein